MTNATLHEKTFAIAWGDMDALGHVNNARYFDYFQEARIEWLQSLHITLRENTGPVLIHAACTFLKPVVYPAIVTLKSELKKVGTTSFVIIHELFQDTQLMAQGESKVVWVDYIKKTSIALPENLLKHLKNPP
jgi:acyl-CoA thioester hydrolase